MKITAIRLRNVKKIGAQGLALENLSDGLNVLSEPNEFGKSTIFEAFRHGLLTKHSSKKEPVKALMPRLSGGAPVVEIDLEYESENYRIRKQFLNQASTVITNLSSGVVIGTADDAQDWIKAAIGADEKLAGPTGLLWVGQGQPLDRPSQSEDQKEVFSSVLDNEVTTVVSGQRGRQLFSKVNGRLSELVTKTGRTTKSYKTEEDKLKNLNADKLELTRKMASAESALNRLAQIATEKMKFDDPERDAELQSNFVDADAAYDSAIQAAPKLEQLNSEAKMKSSACDRMAQRVLELEKDIERGRSLKTDKDNAAEAIKSLKLEITEKEGLLGQLIENRKNADAARASAELVLQKAYSLSASAQAKEDLKRYEDNLKNAMEVREQIEELNTKLATMLIDNNVLAELIDFENKVKVLDASRATSETTFMVSYNTGAGHILDQEGSNIDGGKIYPVHGQANLKLSGIGNLQIKTTTESAKENPEKAFHDAEVVLSARLTELGVESVGQAKAAEKSRYELKQDIMEVQAKFNKFAPDGIQTLKDNIARTAVLAEKGVGEYLDVDAAQKELDEANLKLTRAMAEEEAIDGDHQSMGRKLVGLEAELSGFERELRTLCDEIGKPDIWEKLLSEEKENHEQSLEIAKKARQAYALFQSEAPSLEVAEANRKRCKDAIENRKNRLSALTVESEGLKGQLVSLAADGIEGELSANKGQIERVESNISRFQDEVRALSLLKQTLEDSQEAEKAQLFGPVITELGGLVSQVVQGAEVRIGDDYAASEIIRDGLIETVESLSGGTQEQIAILTRLAFARLKARQGHPTPVILDDALVFSDDTRIASMFTALNLVANDLQIIVLTCRQKSFEGLGGNLLAGQIWPET